MTEEEKDNIEKIKLKDVMSGIRAKLEKKQAKPLKFIKLSSRPDIKYNIKGA